MIGPDRPLFVRQALPAKPAAAHYSADPAVALRQFVARVGGIENARRALAMLALLKRAA
ncbi:MAG TPA: hypothetical protein VL175_15235 [Pirellulales bacterium]|jgi:hypothetical protein|nr:hypothetical protein [Pirellulales bacterium]